MNLQERVNQMRVKKSYNFDHVLIPRDRGFTTFNNPDYRGTGMALCGTLRQGQSLESFKDEFIKRKSN